MLKPSCTFDDQIKQTSSWFVSLNHCNQTSVLCSLINKVTGTQAKFLSLVLDHRLKNGHDTQELSRMENDANNPAFLSSLHNETEDVALQYLLSHVLLLHPGNSKARSEYLKLLTKILFSSEDEEYLYQCRQLLSLALVHPAFPHEEREKLNFWFTRLEEKRRKIMERSVGEHHVNGSSSLKRNPYVNLQALSLPRNSSPQSSPLKKIYQMHTGSVDDNKSNTLNGSNRIYITFPQPSNGLPPTSGFETFDPMGEVNTYPSDSDYDFVQKGFTGFNNSATLPRQEHCHTPDSFKEYTVRSRSKKKCVTLPLQRPSSVCSLPATMDDQSVPVGFLKPGMKEVPGWLRTLRLHKYQYLFADMSYEELISTTEEFLESKDVTKGARNKLLLSIRKLDKRQEILAEIDHDLEKPGNLLSCINELVLVLQTPIKPYQPPAENSTAGLPSDDKDGECQRENSGDVSSNSSPEGSPRHERTHNNPSGGTGASGDDGGSSGDSSSYSSPPSSPRLNRSSSLSSIDDILAKDFPQEDLPSLILKGLGKIFNQLMMHIETNDENLTAFIKGLDTAICHEGFKVSHKRMFFGWKQQCQQTLLVISPRKQARSRGWSNSYTIGGAPSHPNVPFDRLRNGRRVNGRGNNGGSGTLGSTRVGSSPSLLGSPRSVSTLPRANPRQIQQPLPPPYYPPRSRTSSLNSVPTPVPPQIRAHRYVNLPITSPNEVSEMYMDETHELCKSMTEHALEDQ